MTILGTVASSFRSAVAGSFESIASTSLTSSAGSISFTSIPATYEHLQLRMFIPPVMGGDVYVQFNDDTNGNYARHGLVSDGVTIETYTNLSQTKADVGYTNNATYPSVVMFDILNYRSALAKTIRSLGASSWNGTGFIGLRSGYWSGTSAITKMVVTSLSANFPTNTVASLYGMKGVS